MYIALPEHINVLIVSEGAHLFQGVTEGLNVKVIVSDKEISQGFHVGFAPHLLAVLVLFIRDICLCKRREEGFVRRQVRVL